MNPIDYLKGCQIVVWPDTYAVVQAKHLEKDCFAVIVECGGICPPSGAPEIEKTTIGSC